MEYNNPGGVRVGESSAKFPDYQPLARPLVWKHPDTGRTIMNICPLNLQDIIGMDEAESDALIQTLIDAVIQPQFIYEHAWENGDIILWTAPRCGARQRPGGAFHDELYYCSV